MVWVRDFILGFLGPKSLYGLAKLRSEDMKQLSHEEFMLDREVTRR